MSGMLRKWYVVYTKPRWEKKVDRLLTDRGIESYCPLNRVRKKWNDRIKWVEEPLFKSYVFVKIDEDEQMKVRMVSGTVNFVYWLGKPAIVKDNEIEIIRKFLNDYSNVQSVPIDLRADSQIKIIKGAFMDKKAKVIKLLNNKVQVVIECIGYSLVATVEKSNTAVLGKG